GTRVTRPDSASGVPAVARAESGAEVAPLEQPSQVRVGDAGDDIRARFTKACQLRGHAQRGGWLVPAISPWTEPRCVRLHQDRWVKQQAARGTRPLRGTKADRQGERNEEAASGEGGRHFGVTGEAVQRAG